MKKLDQFILKSFLGPFFAILLIVIFVLMLQFLWLYIDELVGKGLGLGVILEFMMWGGCTILPLALPLATLLASMMTMGSFAENMELMAIKSSGISLTRVMVPLMLASVLISVGAFFAGNNLVPKAFNEIFTLRDDIARTKSEIKIPSGTFYDGIEGYILRVETTDKKSGMMHDVMVYDHTDGKGNTSITTADSALIKMSRNKDYLIFTMFSGSNYQENNKKNYSDTSLQLQRINFSRQEMVIPLKNYSFQKSEESRFGDQTKSMRYMQLSHQQDSLKREKKKCLDQSFRRFISSDLFAQHTQLDTMVRSGISCPFEYGGAYGWDDKEELLDAYESASRKAEDADVLIGSYSHEAYEYVFFLRRTSVELLKKLAQALACFILFFIGAPLGAIIRKGGLGTSAIVSALFFVLYWVVDISGTKLANDGAVSAGIGVFISSYVLFPIGMFLSWKAINDQPIIKGVDSFKSWWRRFRSAVTGLVHKPRIVFMGTPEFAVASLDALVRNRYKVVGVVTVADKPSGRGLKMNESAVKKYAVEHGIPVLQPLKLKDPEFLASLRAWKADLFVVVAFRMLPEEVWRMPRLGTFNLHAALLPQYRGAAPINWAVINGERMTGATTFMIDKDIDTGGIILRQELRINPDDTASDVHDALMPLGAELVLQTVQGLIEGSVEMRVQRSFIQGSEVLKPAPKISRELCHIDWNDTTVQVCNLIRGLSDFPTAYTEIVPKDTPDAAPVQLKIFRAHRAESAGEAPGTIISDGKSLLAVATADGAVAIDELQLSGKKRMDTRSFLLGFRNPGDFRCTEGESRAEIEKTRQNA